MFFIHPTSIKIILNNYKSNEATATYLGILQKSVHD